MISSTCAPYSWGSSPGAVTPPFLCCLPHAAAGQPRSQRATTLLLAACLADVAQYVRDPGNLREVTGSRTLMLSTHQSQHTVCGGPKRKYWTIQHVRTSAKTSKSTNSRADKITSKAHRDCSAVVRLYTSAGTLVPNQFSLFGQVRHTCSIRTDCWQLASTPNIQPQTRSM